MGLFFNDTFAHRFFIIIGTVLLLQSELVSQDKINWMSFDEAMEVHQQHKKKVFIDLYTDWCGWCKQMDNTTFSNPVIIDYINNNYIPIKFNGEQKEEVSFKGKTYEFIKHGRRGYHDLAATLTNGNLSYPTFVFLDENLNVIQPLPGYQEETQFEFILNYFGGDFYKTIPWNKFKDDFKPKINNKPLSRNGNKSR